MVLLFRNLFGDWKNKSEIFQEKQLFLCMCGPVVEHSFVDWIEEPSDRLEVP